MKGLKSTTIAPLITVLLLGAILIGCERSAQKDQPAAAQLPADLLANAPPAGALDVAAVRKSARDGENLVIRGRVAGQKDPLAANRAIMTVADLSLPTCDKTPMDNCPTPWDSCCEPTDDIAAKTISVQILGEDGRPIKNTLSGFGGIAPLKEVVVAGTIRAVPGSDTLILHARQIYVVHEP